MVSFGGLLQGALWPHLLEARERLGGSVALLEVVVAGTIALAAGVAALVSRALRVRPTLTLLALWLPATVVSIEYPTLWNPSLTPLALAAFHLSLAWAARTRSTLFFSLAAAALALAVELHIVFALLAIAATSRWTRAT